MGQMNVYIFDVCHGFCALIVAPNGLGALIDCGRSDAFSPVRYICDHIPLKGANGYPLAKLVVSHPHIDHLKDIGNLTSMLRPWTLKRDDSYDWDHDVKGEDDAEGHENLDKYVAFQRVYQRQAKPLDWAGVNMATPTWIRPRDAIGLGSTVNNSSIPVFVEYAGVRILFPGDLEQAGWRGLLERPSFSAELAKGVDFFVASHHGHESGYLTDVFDTMGEPLLNVVSIRHGDENIAEAYSRRAKGMMVNGVKRSCLTTRHDGSILITVDAGRVATVATERLADNEAKREAEPSPHWWFRNRTWPS
jgi:competence protein ComEC